MPFKRKRVLKIIIVAFAILLPLCVAAAAFYWVGTHYRDDEKIYPNISISGIDVSWLTREQAVQALNVNEFEQRVANAMVTIVFPDNSALTITGEDINLTNDAKVTVDDAFLIGRGRGFVLDTVSFIWRLIDGMVFFDFFHEYDLDILHAGVTAFTEDYNERLEAVEPLIYPDKIIITKGVGRVIADVSELKDIAYIGLFESFEAGHPVEIIYTLPEAITDAGKIFNIHQEIYIPVKSAQFDRETWLVEDAVVGVGFDLIRAAELLNETESGKTAIIEVEYFQPEVTREYLESLLFRDLIGEETTWVHGASGRITNVRLSAEAIDGIVLSPGDEFSFNEIVGTRSYSRGYKPAGAFINGEQVSVIGGGICQTSSTIYSAIVDSEILVTERHQHSRSIPYLPRGRDATIFGDKLDLKFVNNTDYPIRIDIELDGRYLTVQVYGTVIDNFPRVAGWNSTEE
jgi:hypothetical protein